MDKLENGVPYYCKEVIVEPREISVSVGLETPYIKYNLLQRKCLEAGQTQRE